MHTSRRVLPSFLLALPLTVSACSGDSNGEAGSASGSASDSAATDSTSATDSAGTVGTMSASGTQSTSASGTDSASASGTDSASASGTDSASATDATSASGTDSTSATATGSSTGPTTGATTGVTTGVTTGPTTGATGSTTGMGGPDCDVDVNATPNCGDGKIAEGEVCYSPTVTLLPGLGESLGGIAWGDWNSDGHVDLFAADRLSDSLAVFSGNSQGEFGRWNVEAPLGGRSNVYPGSATAGDFDDDGDMDLAVLDRGDNQVHIHLNDGFGGLNYTQTISMSLPTSLAVGDFNGDTTTDLAIANANDVAIWNGSQLGQLSGPLNVVGAGGFSLAVGDVDGNGEPDLVSSSSNNARVTLSNPNAAGFLATNSFPFGGGNGYGVAVADMDKDTYLDVVVVASGAFNHVAILEGDGSGTSFVGDPMLEQPSGANPWDLDVADLDGDGWLDVVVAQNTSQDLGVFMGNGGTSIIDPMVGVSLAGISDARSLAVGDVDGDSTPDVVVSGQGNSRVGIAIGDGAGGFTQDAVHDAVFQANAVELADFTGDGSLDFVNLTAYTSTNNLYQVVNYWINDGGGVFASGYSPEVTDVEDVAVGDFDNDGDSDVVMTRPTGNYIYVVVGNGRGGFSDAAIVNTGSSPGALTLGHFNADAFLDVLVANEASPYLSLLPGLGTGDFGAQLQLQNLENEIKGLAVGDLDGDMMDDFVTANRSTDTSYVFLRTGNYFFATPPPTLMTGQQPEDVTVGDLDNDGDLDVVVANANWDRVSVFLGNGDGTFAAGSLFDVGVTPSSVELLDADNDGDLDIATSNFGSNDVTIILGDGGGSFDAANPETYDVGGDGWEVVAVDVNGDCIRDLALTSTTSDSIELLLSNP